MALASGTIVSRVLGFVSISVLTATIGTLGSGPNAFALANQLPTYIYALVAGGLLSAVLVPHIVKAATQSDGGQAFVNRLVTLGVVVFAMMTVAATLAAPWIVQLYALASNTGSLANGGLELAITMAYWCLPQIFFYAVYALVGEVLSARGVFGPAAWAPALNNVVMVGSLVLFGVLYGTGSVHRNAASWDSEQIAVIAGGATLGVALQAVLLLFFWRRTGLRFRPDFRWRGAGLGAPARAAGWVFGMVIVVQVTNFVQTNVASTAHEDDASLAVLRITWLIFMLSHSIIAISIATPVLHSDGDRRSGCRHPGAARGPLGVAAPDRDARGRGRCRPRRRRAAVRRVLRRRARPRHRDRVGGIPRWPRAVQHPLRRSAGVLRLGDTRTPFVLQIVQSAIFVVGALALLLAPSEWIAAGIALVTSLSVIVQAVAAALILRTRLGGGGRTLTRRFGTSRWRPSRRPG